MRRQNDGLGFSGVAGGDFMAFVPRQRESATDEH